jgi:hypothetical protein
MRKKRNSYLLFLLFLMKEREKGVKKSYCFDSVISAFHSLFFLSPSYQNYGIVNQFTEEALMFLPLISLFHLTPFLSVYF